MQMANNLNILITSVGRRNLLLEYIKKELNGLGKLIATDCSKFAPALYMADKYYIVPEINDQNYIDTILSICKEEEVTAIFSLIDPELSLISKYSTEFRDIGVFPVVSPYEVCEMFFDKYSTSLFCKKNGYLCPKTYITFQDFEKALENKELNFPVLIKPRRGSASLNINKAENIVQAKCLVDFSEDKGIIIQEFLKGKELGIDVYVDLISKEVISIFVKEKVAMRAGETDKAKSIKSTTLFEIVSDFVKKAGLVGPIDMDIIEYEGKYYILEVNPRFGGGYPLAYECGVNFPKYLINNLKGVINTPDIGNYEENIYMMKYDILTIRKGL